MYFSLFLCSYFPPIQKHVFELTFMTQPTVRCKPLACLSSQEAAWYLRRHRQELELLLIGSKTMGVEFIDGVSKQNTQRHPKACSCYYKLKLQVFIDGPVPLNCFVFPGKKNIILCNLLDSCL